MKIGSKKSGLEAARQTIKFFETALRVSIDGIGLAIVKKAVDKLGGTIRIESKPEERSTFFIKLSESLKE